MTDVDYIPAVQDGEDAARANRDRLAVGDAPATNRQETDSAQQSVVPGNNALDSAGIGNERPNVETSKPQNGAAKSAPVTVNTNGTSEGLVTGAATE